MLKYTNNDKLRAVNAGIAAADRAIAARTPNIKPATIFRGERGYDPYNSFDHRIMLRGSP